MDLNFYKKTSRSSAFSATVNDVYEISSVPDTKNGKVYLR